MIILVDSWRKNVHSKTNTGPYPKLTLIYFIKIPKSDDDAILMLEVLLQSKIQIYYAEIIAKENYEYFVTKSVVSYKYLFLR